MSASTSNVRYASSPRARVATPPASARPRLPHLVAGIVASLLLASAAAGQASATPQAGEAPLAPGMGRLTIVQSAQDSLRIQVRVGSAPDCDDNVLATTLVIPRGRVWSIDAAGGFCWRVEDATEPGRWSAWWTRPVTPGQVQQVTP